MIKKLLFACIITLGLNSFAQTVVYEEDFNDESTWESWTLADLDEDGELWEFADAEFQEVESFEGGFVWSFSWYLEVFTPDNTLTSPNISLPTENNLELTFNVAAYEDEEVFQEHYAVYVIPADSEFTGTEEPVFEETLDAPYYNPAKTINVDITPFAGQEVKLVFRHYDCTDIFYIGMDDVQITQSELGVDDIQKENIKVYPNPTTDIVSVQGVPNVNSIRVFNLQGKLLKETNASEINIEQFQSGTYLINFYTDKTVYSRKVIKK